MGVAGAQPDDGPALGPGGALGRPDSPECGDGDTGDHHGQGHDEIAIKGRRWDWTVRAEALAPGPSNPAARALWTMLPDQKPTLTGA